MTAPRPTPPNGHPVSPRPEPLQMSPGEKVAAEWEARHDVRARGSHGHPSAVQDYLQHARREEQRHPSSAPQPRTVVPSEDGPTSEPAERPSSSWLFRLLHRRSGG